MCKKVIDESDFLKFDYEKVKDKIIHINTDTFVLGRITVNIHQLMDGEDNNIITAKYLYYSICNDLQNILAYYFDINPYVFDEENYVNYLSEIYEEFLEYLLQTVKAINKLDSSSQNVPDILKKFSEEGKTEETYKIIYCRYLYILGTLLKVIKD